MLNAKQKVFNNIYTYKTIIKKSVLLSQLQKKELTCRQLFIKKQ